MFLFNNFTDTIFLKKSSDLEDRLKALNILKEKYPNNMDLLEEYYIVKKGLDGEKEIEYQLTKSNLGMYVLHDINIEVDDLKAQIDYVIFTKTSTYLVECKNLIGNITVNEKGDFIREYVVNNRKIKKGMYSPIRQVEAQKAVLKKLWLSQHNKLEQALFSKKFDNNYKTLVVAANNETILNTRFAPKDIKRRVLKSDALIRKLEEDINDADRDSLSNKKQLEECANSFLSKNVSKTTDYIEYYKEKFNLDETLKEVKSDDLKERLIKFRKERSSSMGIPAYYVFTNDELDKIIELKPNTLEELINAKILSNIKIKTHGKEIINVINNS